MFETYYEIEHKKMTEDGFTDYKNMSGVSCIYAVCECEGRIKDKAFPCVRNQIGRASCRERVSDYV